MPSLSIIVPFVGNVAELEATLLSVLENRPSESEILVVHDGSYSDPYRLGDEVIFVEADPGSSQTQLFNAGVLAACSPVVHTLVGGITVVPNWTNKAVRQLQSQSELAAVALGVSRGKPCSYGIDAGALSNLRRLRQGGIELARPSGNCAGPDVRCGFFRRKVLLALDGFNGSLDARSASLDIAYALRELQLEAHCETEIIVRDHSARREPLHWDRMAALAVAYGVLEAGLGAAAREFANCLLGGNLKASVAWCGGLLSVPQDPNKRLAQARIQLEEARQGGLRVFVGQSEQAKVRRAA